MPPAPQAYQIAVIVTLPRNLLATFPVVPRVRFRDAICNRGHAGRLSRCAAMHFISEACYLSMVEPKSPILGMPYRCDVL